MKGHKRPKDLTGDKQKTDIEGIRRTRNYRPTRKRKTRCYGHKGKKKKQNKRKMKCMQGYLDQSRRCREVSTIGFQWIEVAIEQLLSIQKVSRWIKVAIEKLSRWAKTVFQIREKQRLECNQACYPTQESNNMLSS